MLFAHAELNTSAGAVALQAGAVMKGWVWARAGNLKNDVVGQGSAVLKWAVVAPSLDDDGSRDISRRDLRCLREKLLHRKQRERPHQASCSHICVKRGCV